MAAAVARTRHERWRRAGRTVGFVLAGTSLLLAITAIAAWRYAGTSAGRARLGALVQRQLGSTLPGLRLGQVGHDGGELIASGVDLWDKDGRRAIHVELVRLRPHWTALLHRRVALDEARLEGARILVRPTSDGRTLNVATLVAPREPDGSPAARPEPNAQAPHLPIPVVIDRLVITDAEVDLLSGPEAPRVVVRGLELEGRLESAGRRTQVAVERLDARVAVDQRALAVTARASGSVDEDKVELLLDTVRVTGATPAGAVAVRAGASGPRESLRVWATGAGPGDAKLSLTGAVGLGPRGLGHYRVDLAADAPVLSALVDGAPPGGVSLQARAAGDGTPLAPDSRTAVAAYFPSLTVAGRALEQAYVQASSTGSAWRLERAEARAAGFDVRASGRGEGPELHARVNVTVHDISSARRTAGLRRSTAPAVPQRGAGRLDATVDGRLDGQLTFAANARARALAATAWGRLARLDLTVRGTARRAPEWTVRARASGSVSRLDGPQLSLGAARVRGTAAVAGQGAQALQVADVSFRGTGVRVGESFFDRLDVEGRAGRTDVSLSLAAAGRSGTATVSARGRRTPQRLDLTVDKLDLALAAPGPRQRVTLDRPASIVVRPGRDVQILDLAVRGSGELLSGRAVVSAAARLGPPPAGTDWARLDVTLDRLTTAGLPAVTGYLHATADGQRARGKVDLRMDASTLSARLDVPAVIRSSLAELRLSREGNIDVSLDGQNVHLASLPPLQRALSRYGLVGGTLTAHATVTGPLARPDAKLALDVRALELRDVTGEGRDSAIHTIPGIGASVRLDTGADDLRARGTLFMYGAGVATFSARLAAGPGALLAGTDVRTVPFSARVHVPRFQLNALKSLSDELRDTRGWLTGHAELDGTMGRPRGAAELSVAELHVDQLSVGRVVAKVTTDGDTLRAEASLGAPGQLDARAVLSLGARRTLDAHIRTRGLNPGVVRPFLTGVRELNGVVDADVRARGPLPNLTIEGRVYVYRGSLGVIGQPTFRNIGAAVAMRAGRLELETLQMYSGGGSLEASGWVTLDGLRPRNGVLTGNAHRFVIAAAGVSGARLDGSWAVEVARRDSVLAGTLDVPQAALWLPKLALGGRKPQRITPRDDVRFVDGASRAAEARRQAEERAGDTGGAPPLAVKMQARARTIYVRGKDMDVELESNVTLKTPPSGHGPLQLLGAVRFRRGHINIQGQRFEVGTGSITFDGPPTAPQLDINLSRTYPDARVLVGLRGRPDKPQLRLSSEPPIYDQGQIVSLILTGQAQGRAGGAGGGAGSFDPTATIATAVLSKLADKVAPEIGLDVIRVERAKPTEQSATTAAGDFAGRVEVGKYINDRVYVSYAHRFGATERQNANEGHAEYRISPHWIAETVFGDAGVGGVDAFWIYRY